MVNVQEIYEKFCNGDYLNDVEVDTGVEHFTTLTRLLHMSGPTFKLAGNEARRVQKTLAEIRQARRLAKTWTNPVSKL